MTPAPTRVNSLRTLVPASQLRVRGTMFDAGIGAVLWSAQAVVGGPWEIRNDPPSHRRFGGRARAPKLHQEQKRMSRLEDAQKRLDAALRRLDSALQALEAASRTATDSRDRQISSLIAELTAIRQERDTLNNVADQAVNRIDAVIDRLRAAGVA
jgi:multidrug efflux pump subunit AcrA (membrane-fusion protein)